MSWEQRDRGGRYYTRSRRVGGRIVREYVGRGSVAILSEREDRQAREERQVARLARSREREEAAVLGERVRQVDALAEALTAAALLLAGYHRHDRGAWRRRYAG
jgi:hypothetical protein